MKLCVITRNAQNRSNTELSELVDRRVKMSLCFLYVCDARELEGNRKLSDDRMISLRKTNVSNSENESIMMGQALSFEGNQCELSFLALA